MKYFLSFVLALVMALLIIGSLSEVVVPEGAAVATQVEGTVRLFTADAPEGRLIGNNDSMAKDDRVEVGANSRLELRLPDGGWLRLSENTRLTMRLLRFEPLSGTLYMRAFLHNGTLWATIKKRATPDFWVEVLTGTGLIAAKDTVCAVTAENSGTTVNVYEGAVVAMSAAGEAPPTGGRTGAPAEIRPVSVQPFQQVAVSAREGAAQPQDFDPKAAINDWVRWNLQRDAREGLASITVAPASPTVTKGGSLQCTGIAHYPDNVEKDVTWFATWSSSDDRVAKIDPLGIAAAAELGAATISAAIGDMSGSTVLNVSSDLRSIAVTPASRSIMNGAIQQFTAKGTFSDRTVKDITSSVVWRSSNAAVAFVDSAGRVVAGNKTGNAVISASLGTKRGSARLKVRRELVSLTIMPESAEVMAGETQRFGAIGSYSDGTTEDLTERVRWQTSDASMAEIDQAQAGRVIGQGKAGRATIRASYKRKSGSATITLSTMDTISAP